MSEISRLLVTGGSGLFAVNLALALRQRAEVVLAMHERKIAIQGVESVSVDLESAELSHVLQMLRPDLVIHTAGMTNVEQCEAHPQDAQRLHVTISESIARACQSQGTKLVHISTDHLFDGCRKLTDEEAMTSPRNTYGVTKAAAEKVVMEAAPDALIVRTNFFGWGPPYRRSFSDTILQALRAGRPLVLFNDVFYTPILIEAAVTTIMDLVSKGSRGIYNVVGDDRISKLDFGLALASEFGLPVELIRSGSILDRPGLIPRPMDMSLSNKKACEELGRKLGGVREHLRRLHQQEQDGFAREIQSL